MSKKTIEEDFSSFREALKGVRPLKNDRIDLYAHQRNTRPYRDKNNYEEDTFQVYLSDERQSSNIGGEEFIFLPVTVYN